MADISGFAKAAAVIFVLSLLVLFFSRGGDYTGPALELDTAVLSVLGGKGIDEKDLVYENLEKYRDGRHLFLKIVRHYKVKPGFDADGLIDIVREQKECSKFVLLKSVFEKGSSGESYSFFFSFRNRVLYELKFLKAKHYTAKLPKAKGGKIAIVLDDFGYNMNNLDRLFEIKSSLTISILPNLPYSKQIAEEAGRHGVEVMLHLPLEPHGGEVGLEKGTIMVDMPAEEVNNIFVEAIKNVPGLKGVSNHMGSKATENRALMARLFTELKARDLYFVDNLVTDKSVCGEVASEIGLRATARSVFLDNESDESYIEEQVLRTADLAARTGWAIGTGHDKSSTIKVLAKVLPRLENAGFKLVHVSELVR